MNHTPGPWTWRDAWPSDDGKLNPCRLAGRNEETVLESNSKSDIRLSREDGNLIAAAPELLAAIERLTSVPAVIHVLGGTQHRSVCACAYCEAQSAIAKARGQ